MGYYSFIDITGIQRTIFETNRQKIILGASLQLANWQDKCAGYLGTGKLVSSAGGNVFAYFEEENNESAYDYAQKCSDEAALIGFGSAWAVAEGTPPDTVDILGHYRTWQSIQREIGRHKAGDRDPCDYTSKITLDKYWMFTFQKNHICHECGTRPAEKPDLCEICESRLNTSPFCKSKTLFNRLYVNNSFPTELKDLASTEKGEDKPPIAIITIDLNNMGKRFLEYVRSDGFNDFRKMSETLDNNLFEIYNKAISAASKPKHCVPLLLAGDDAVFAMPVSSWVPFVKSVFDSLTEKNLMACAGVVIAPHNYPFSRLVNMAEELCASAKERFRYEQSKSSCFNECVVDWHVFKESAFVSVMEARRRGFVKVEKNGIECTISTKKPYAHSEFNSLASTADSWKKDKNLSEGKLFSLYRAILAGEETTRNVLVYEFLRDEKPDLTKYAKIWEKVNTGGLWHEYENSPYTVHVSDTADCIELGRMI